MNKKAVIIIVVLLLLCCCISVMAGLGIYWYTQQSKTNSNGTITTSITPTTYSTVSLTPSTEVKANKSILDTFDSNINGWTLDESDTEYAYSEETIVGGKLNLYVEAKKSVIVWDTIDTAKPTDFELAVDGSKISGSKEGDYALVFRKLDDDNYYIFIVNEEYQEYELAVRKDGEWKKIIPWTESKNILLNKVNKLKVNVVGSTFKVYINNQLENTIIDASITEAGQVGIAIDLYGADQAATFEFDNFSLKIIK